MCEAVSSSRCIGYGACRQVAVHLEVEDINAHLTRLDGVEMLDRLRKEGRLTETLQLAVPIADGAGAEHRGSTDGITEQGQQHKHGGGDVGSQAAGVGAAVA
jgi:hypothetical protein